MATIKCSEPKFIDEMSKLKVQCSCGTKTIIPTFIDRKICRNCGKYVYRNKEIEFKYKLASCIKDNKLEKEGTI